MTPFRSNARRPTLLARVAVFSLLWFLAGVFCYYNYVTDACPPEVHQREALLHGLLAPLSFAGAVGSAPCVPTVGLRAIVSIGYLLAWLALVYFTFRVTSIWGFVSVIALLIGLYTVGGCCLIYMNEHGYS
jgi:hypothetical protein